MADDLVTIATYRFAHAADVDRLHLETEGIPAFLADVNIVTADWGVANAVGDIKLQVPRTLAQRARQLLAARARPTPSIEGSPSDDSTYCLACGQLIGPDQEACPACGWTYDHVVPEE
jgi:hypothetical protein